MWQVSCFLFYFIATFASGSDTGCSCSRGVVFCNVWSNQGSIDSLACRTKIKEVAIHNENCILTETTRESLRFLKKVSNEWPNTDFCDKCFCRFLGETSVKGYDRVVAGPREVFPYKVCHCLKKDSSFDKDDDETSRPTEPKVKVKVSLDIDGAPSGMAPGVIAAIIIFVLFVVVVGGLGIFFGRRHYKRKSRDRRAARDQQGQHIPFARAGDGNVLGGGMGHPQATTTADSDNPPAYRPPDIPSGAADFANLYRVPVPAGSLKQEDITVSPLLFKTIYELRRRMRETPEEEASLARTHPTAQQELILAAGGDLTLNMAQNTEPVQTTDLAGRFAQFCATVKTEEDVENGARVLQEQPEDPQLGFKFLLRECEGSLFVALRLETEKSPNANDEFDDFNQAVNGDDGESWGEEGTRRKHHLTSPSTSQTFAGTGSSGIPVLRFCSNSPLPSFETMMQNGGFRGRPVLKAAKLEVDTKLEGGNQLSQTTTPRQVATISLPQSPGSSLSDERTSEGNMNQTPHRPPKTNIQTPNAPQINKTQTRFL